VNPFAARLFSVLAGIFTVVLVYRMTRKIINEGVAFFSALVMIASLQLVIQFHLAVPDPYLIFLMTSSFFLFYEGFQNGNRKSMLAFYAVAGFAFLTKGLIAVVLPGIVIFLFVLLRGNLNREGLLKLRLFYGAALFLLVALPWYVAVGYATQGAWLEGFFFKHNLERFTSTMEGHRGFLFAPFVIIVAALLPFSVFIVQAARLAWIKRKDQPFLFLCLLIGIVVPAFFSFSKTILPSYPAPALPFVAIVLGYYLRMILVNMDLRVKPVYFSFAFYLLITLAIPAGIYFALDQEKVFQPLRFMAFWFLILPVGAISAVYLFYMGKRTLSIYTLVSSWVVISLIFFYVCYPAIDKQNPVAQSMQFLKTEPASVAYYGSFNPAFVFALKTPVKKLNTQQEVDDFFNAKEARYLITYKKYLPDLESIPNLKITYRQKDLFEKYETVILVRR
jgi:4-amino-4-deoxy-L-arabinose transferase-like glycosyltransferase